MTRVVLFTRGSFDPPTIMHLRMFEMARDHLSSLEHRVLAGLMSPLHDKCEKSGFLTSRHRRNMVKLSVIPSFSMPLEISSWETEQSDCSSTRSVLDAHQQMLTGKDFQNVPWLKHIRNEEDLDQIKMYLLIDETDLNSLNGRGLWNLADVRHILENYGLVIITRGEGAVAQRFLKDSQLLSDYKQRIHLVPSHMGNDISSTKVRCALEQSRSVLHLVPKNVVDYILHYRLYTRIVENP